MTPLNTEDFQPERRDDLCGVGSKVGRRRSRLNFEEFSDYNRFPPCLRCG
jgi:hypothetical protein